MKFKDDPTIFLKFYDFNSPWLENKPYSGTIEWSDGGRGLDALGEIHFYKNGKHHNENGQSAIWYGINIEGKKEICYQYSLNGKIFSEENWKIEVEKLKKSGLDLK